MGTVYKITCAECPASYLGETGRTLECRIKEHKRCIANKDASNIIAVHHMAIRHEMDWGRSHLLGVCITLWSENVFGKLAYEEREGQH